MDMILPIPFSPAFFRLILTGAVNIDEVDQGLARALELPEGLIGGDFTYPGYPDLELKPGGQKIAVTAANLSEYIDLIRNRTVQPPDVVESFRAGLSTVVPWEFLRLFSVQELCELVGGKPTQITEEDLRESVDVSHGYTKESPQVAMLFAAILEMTAGGQALFVQFLTGTDKLPIGGLKVLNPRLTIALRTPEGDESPDDTLPSVMTCANYFKLPEYSSKEILKAKLLLAITEGQNVFMLT
jgi:hypothetical protein